MSLTNNPNVLKWVEEMTALTKPDKVVWIDGSKEQIEALKKEALSTGEMQELNQEKLPGCLYHRTLPNDVARVEDRTFICCKIKKTQVRQITGAILRKCMQSSDLCTTAL